MATYLNKYNLKNKYKLIIFVENNINNSELKRYKFYIQRISF